MEVHGAVPYVDSKDMAAGPETNVHRIYISLFRDLGSRKLPFRWSCRLRQYGSTVKATRYIHILHVCAIELKRDPRQYWDHNTRIIFTFGYICNCTLYAIQRTDTETPRSVYYPHYIVLVLPRVSLERDRSLGSQSLQFWSSQNSVLNTVHLHDRTLKTVASIKTLVTLIGQKERRKRSSIPSILPYPCHIYVLGNFGSEKASESWWTGWLVSASRRPGLKIQQQSLTRWLIFHSMS